MQKRHLKRAAFIAIRGILLTLIAVALQSGHYLAWLESTLYDARMIHCQAYRPPPEKSLVQLDIDDNALNYIGHWPWSSLKIARILDEITLTKPKIMAMDVLWVEPKEIVYKKMDNVGVDEDGVLAKSIANLGCAVVPLSLKFDDSGPSSKLHSVLLTMLIDDPELPQMQCIELLKRQGIGDADFSDDASYSFLEIREQAFYERIWREVSARKDSLLDLQTLKHIMLPHADPLLTKTVLGDLLEDQYNRVLRERAIRRFTLPLPSAELPILHAADEKAPILPLGEAAAYSGFVDYLPESVEGKVRSVPLLVQYRDRLIPQMAFVTACAMLGVDIHKIRLSADSVVIPRPDGKDVYIPVSKRDRTAVGQAGMLMEVPLFGRTNDWLTMYDFPQYKTQAQHVSVYEVWRICETKDRLEHDQAALNQELRQALDLTDPDAATAYIAAPPVGEAKRQLVEKTLQNTTETINNLSAEKDLDPDTKHLLDQYKTVDATLRLVVDQNNKLELQLTQLRTNLYAELHNRAIFFGGTATGLLDLQPTSLFGECPGIVIHGAIFNAILTGKMYRVIRPHVDWVITACAGLLTLVLVMRFSPIPGFIASLMLALGYLAFNGYYLFAYKNLIVTAAGPIVSIGMVLAGVTLTNLLIERSEKSRITKRFRNYVDPGLVNWVVDHPENIRFDGERREMTVGFSDLVGFTTLTDEMGEKVVPLLAEYMGKMVPVIRSHEGHVAQLIGDGIYFFFGAPRPDESHAMHAVRTALGMHSALADFNVTLRDRSTKTLGMRIGISTGEVVVGDAGPADASAYTAMGATTNLASRLESANKVFGTHTLITARTVELLNGAYLVRPIANVRVAGKLDSVIVYEPLCLAPDSTDEDRRLTDFTTRMFEAYRVANFEACITAAKAMEDVYGSNKLTKLYTHLSTEQVASAAVEFCEGQIVLTEK